nr:asparaginase [Gemmatimonadaceae bacterium]
EHVALALAMLADVGLEEGDLACGAHEPLAARGARLLREAAALPTRAHNNCSGKHAAMLAASTTHGWTPHGYERPLHPVQRRIRETLPTFTALDDERIELAIDGCGVPVFVLPLRNMATAWGRLARHAHDEAAAARVLTAMATHPFLVGGTDRFDTVVMEETGGNVVCKIGAEGVHSLCIRDRALGLAVKVADGAQRAQYPAVLRLLQHLHALPATLPPRLAAFLVTPVRNTRGETVGEIHPAA